MNKTGLLLSAFLAVQTRYGKIIYFKPLVMEALIKKLQSLNTATKENIALIKDLFFKAEFKKGWVLSNIPWQRQPTLHFVKEGLVRGCVKYGEKTYTLWLVEKGFLVPANGFMAGFGVGETVEFLQDTMVYSLDLLKADLVAQKNSSLYKMLMEIYEQSLFEGRQREIMLRMQEARERIEFMAAVNEHLMYKTDRNIFASFLKISPRHLGRFKRKIN